MSDIFFLPFPSILPQIPQIFHNSILPHQQCQITSLSLFLPASTTSQNNFFSFCSRFFSSALFTRFFCKIKHNEKLSKSLFNKDLRQFSLLRIRMVFCRAIRGSAVASLPSATLGRHYYP